MTIQCLHSLSILNTTHNTYRILKQDHQIENRHKPQEVKGNRFLKIC